MVPNDEKGVDPTVETIVEMFPEDFLRKTDERRELSNGSVKLM